MSAVLKSSSVCAAAAVPLAASSASPETRSRRLSEPFSKRDTRSEMIASMAASFLESERPLDQMIQRPFVLTSSRRLRLHPVGVACRHESDRYHGELRSEEHTSELQSLAYLVC